MKTNSAGLIRNVIAFIICLSLFSSSSLYAAPASFGDTSLTIYNYKKTGDTYLRLNEINIHAARDFAKRFSTVTDDKWLKTDDGYLARFIIDDKRNDAYYDNRGHFIASSCYYNEDNIPSDIQDLISREYPGYTITGLTRISVPERSFYRLHISNPEFIKTLQVINSRIRVLETLQNIAANF